MTDSLIILAGNAHPQLARRIADTWRGPWGGDVSRFPDGRSSSRSSTTSAGTTATIVQPTCHPPKREPDELLIMIRPASARPAARIHGPHAFYGTGAGPKDQAPGSDHGQAGRQPPGGAGTDRLMTMDLHAQQIQGFFDIPVDHCTPAPVIVKYLGEGKPISDLVVVSPDPGGLKMAYAYSNMLGAGWRSSPSSAKVRRPRWRRSASWARWRTATC